MNADRFDVALALSYYSPYVSGLTEVARVVAETLAARGRRVGVVTTRHDPHLPATETRNGVHIERSPVLGRIGKGVVSPAFPLRVASMARRARVLNLHLPMIESGPVTRLVGATPVVSMYHCDVELGDSRVDRLAVDLLDRSNRAALRRSDAVVVTSVDYARSSRLADAIPLDPVVIPPPCIERPAGRPRFRETPGRHVGFLGRIVAEKGLEYLIRGFRLLEDPEARLLIAGDYDRVAGGSVIDAVRQEIGDDHRVRLLGFLPDDALADFYASLDAFVLPSVNALEAFGIVQVEAMLAGVPVVATDLPGIRVPLQQTDFGVLVPPRDPSAIRAALDRLPGDDAAAPARERAIRLFGVDAVVDAYDELFARLGR